MTQDDLDQRLRRGFAALAAEAPDPPRLAAGHLDASPQVLAARSATAIPNRRRVLVPAALVLIVVAISAIAVARHPAARATSSVRATSSTSVPTRIANLPLAGTGWTLTAAVRNGKRVAVGGWHGSIEFVVPPSCSSLAGCNSVIMTGDDGCNSFSGTVAILGDRVVAQSGVAFTEAACQLLGRDVSIFENPRVDEPFTAVVSGSSLAISTADGRVFDYHGVTTSEPTTAGDDAAGLPYIDGTEWVSTAPDSGIGLSINSFGSGGAEVTLLGRCLDVAIIGSIDLEGGKSTSAGVRTGAFSHLQLQPPRFESHSGRSKVCVGSESTVPTALKSAVSASLGGGSYRIVGDRLALLNRVGFEVAAFDANSLDSNLAHPHPLLSGTAGTASYQLLWQAGPHGQMYLEYLVSPGCPTPMTPRDCPDGQENKGGADPGGTDQALSTLVATSQRASVTPYLGAEPLAARLPLTSEIFDYGIAPPGTTKVVIRYTDGPTASLRVYPVGRGLAVLFGSVVPGRIGGNAVVTATDADGRVLGAWHGSL